MVGSKLMEAVGVYSLALRTVFKFGSKVENGKLKLWPASHRRFVTSNAMHCRYLWDFQIIDRLLTTYTCYVDFKESFSEWRSYLFYFIYKHFRLQLSFLWTDYLRLLWYYVNFKESFANGCFISTNTLHNNATTFTWKQKKEKEWITQGLQYSSNASPRVNPFFTTHDLG